MKVHYDVKRASILQLVSFKILMCLTQLSLTADSAFRNLKCPLKPKPGIIKHGYAFKSLLMAKIVIKGLP